MTAKEQLIQEIEQVSDLLAEEVLNFLLFVKQRQDQKNLIASDEESQLPQPSILDRMGGMPQHLLSVGNLSDRDSRRAVIASRIKQSQQQP
jgi:hypothetical protein